MATERQIAANRANAKFSTGPRSAEGLAKASRNSYRHGLSCSAPLDEESLAELDQVARILVGPAATSAEHSAARQLLMVQLELLRIRTVRDDLLKNSDGLPGGSNLRGLVGLDRYERRALTRRRREGEKVRSILAERTQLPTY